MVLHDYKKLFNEGATAEKLADIYLEEYYGPGKIIFPINSFQMLADEGIIFGFRPFKNYEGVYISAVDKNDTPIVGINLKSTIGRQRFTAAHELCHHLKDTKSQFTCSPNSKSKIEKYADNFASELLMPSSEFEIQVNSRLKNGCLDFDGVLEVANFFGVSFQACLYKAAYKLNVIYGDTSPTNLRKLANVYKPQAKRYEKGLYYTNLYEQLFNAIGDNFEIIPTPYACQKFKAEYIFQDSRMEGLNVNAETVGDIVADLRINKQNSKFCKEENGDIIEISGLTLAYDYAFEQAEKEISIYDAKHINEEIYATAPYPEFGGTYRQSNTLVLGAKFETIDYYKIPEEMLRLDDEIKILMSNCLQMSYSDFIENVIRIHHRLTVIHAFRDGNGRTSRAFCNMMLLRRHISPAFFNNKTKGKYIEALSIADTTGEYDALYEVFYKAILESYARLSDTMI